MMKLKKDKQNTMDTINLFIVLVFIKWFLKLDIIYLGSVALIFLQLKFMVVKEWAISSRINK